MDRALEASASCALAGHRVMAAGADGLRSSLTPAAAKALVRAVGVAALSALKLANGAIGVQDSTASHGHRL
jgi:hypothetical protein